MRLCYIFGFGDTGQTTILVVHLGRACQVRVLRCSTPRNSDARLRADARRAVLLSDADMGSEDNPKPPDAAEAAPGAAGRRKRKPGTKKKAGTKWLNYLLALG